MTAVFIGHWNGASGYAYPLLDALRQRLGEQHVEMDQDGVRADLPRCDAVVVLIDPSWAGRSAAGSDAVHDQIVTALRQGVRVIPVLVLGAARPAADRLPEDLAPLLARQSEVLREEAWQRDLNHLAELLASLPETSAPITAANGHRMGLARRIPADVQAVTCLAFADDREVAAGATDGALRFIRVSDGKLNRSFPVHRDRVTCLAPTQDGRTVATASTDAVVCTWNAANGVVLRQLSPILTTSSLQAESESNPMLVNSARAAHASRPVPDGSALVTYDSMIPGVISADAVEAGRRTMSSVARVAPGLGPP